jgi:hypothetical protein
VLLQKFVEGEGTGYFALMHQGELRAEFAHRRIRDIYPTRSRSAVRVTTAVDPKIRRSSLAILAALHWHGVAMVKYRHKSGSPAVFMEVSGALLAFAAAGYSAMPGIWLRFGKGRPQATRVPTRAAYAPCCGFLL